jgi:hypothetical protein
MIHSSEKALAVHHSLSNTSFLAIDHLLQIRHNRALPHITIALRRAVDHLPQRAEPIRASRQAQRLGAERNGSRRAGGEELY